MFKFDDRLMFKVDCRLMFILQGSEDSCDPVSGRVAGERRSKNHHFWGVLQPCGRNLQPSALPHVLYFHVLPDCCVHPAEGWVSFSLTLLFFLQWYGPCHLVQKAMINYCMNCWKYQEQPRISRTEYIYIASDCMHGDWWNLWFAVKNSYRVEVQHMLLFCISLS